MPRRTLPFVVLLAVSVCSCQTEFDNPFVNPNPTLAPPAGADLIFASNSYTPRPGAPRDLFAAGRDGSGLTRLTFCNTEERSCDSVEASPAPDRRRVIVRRILQDTNGDGTLSPADGEALVFVDLSRGTQAVLTPASSQVSGLDWSPTGDVLVYSARGVGGQEDLWRMDPNGQNNRNLTSTPAVRERRPRIDPTGSIAVFERIETSGKGQIYIFNSSIDQVRITTGGPGAEPLPGTPYVVGSDADPSFSPDGRSVVFRRSTGPGNGGLGSWDILTVRADGSGLSPVASGPVFRGAPDWGPQGIVFNEVDLASGTSRLVVVEPDGTRPRYPVTLGAAFDLGNPRWLP